MPRTCLRCGRFISAQRCSAYCSDPCEAKGPMPPRPICTWCGRSIRAYPSQRRGEKAFCNRECRGKWQTNHETGENARNWRGGPSEVACAHCGAKFERPAWDVKPHNFCSDSCHRAWRRTRYAGQGNPAWRGGTTRLRRKNHHSQSWWPKTIKARAMGHCELCGRASTRLHAHHIIRYADAPDLRDDLRNGIALCPRCHRAVHAGNAVVQMKLYMECERQVV